MFKKNAHLVYEVNLTGIRNQSFMENIRLNYITILGAPAKKNNYF